MVMVQELERLRKEYEALISRKNEKCNKNNGVYVRYKYPVLLPFFWVWRLLVKGFKKRNIVKCELESIKNAK